MEIKCFLHADEHQSFYELTLLFFMEVTRQPKFPKQEVSNFFAIYEEKSI